MRSWRNGKVQAEFWCRDGEAHCADGPAIVNYYESGALLSEEWYVNGERHREEGPEKRGYDESGYLRYEEWWLRGQRYRADSGPTYVSHHSPSDGGGVDIEKWVTGDKEQHAGGIHREGGPAFVRHHPDGSISFTGWLLDGKEVSAHQVMAPSWGVSRDNAPAIAYLEGFDYEELSAEHPAVRLALSTNRNP